MTHTPHSADVRLWLLLGDRAIKLSHTASDYVIIAAGEPLEPCQPCSAVVVVIIDGEPFSRTVSLPNGIECESVDIVSKD